VKTEPSAIWKARLQTNVTTPLEEKEKKTLGKMFPPRKGRGEYKRSRGCER